MLCPRCGEMMHIESTPMEDSWDCLISYVCEKNSHGLIWIDTDSEVINGKKFVRYTWQEEL